MITKQRWLEAQNEERKFHNSANSNEVEARKHYLDSYRQYFEFLEIDFDLKGKNVVEIGPADFPALSYCSNLGEGSFVIEPMPSEILKSTGLKIVQELAEDLDYKADEVWLMNVLQHVINPYKIVERAKKQSKIIRFFEPVNYGVDVCHPWNLTMDMFIGWFGEVKHYPGNPNAVNFHTWENAYGVYICDL